MFGAKVHEYPEGRLSRIEVALDSVPWIAGMPRATGLRFDLDRDASCLGQIAGQYVDVGHVASEAGCVTSAPVDPGGHKQLSGWSDLPSVHGSSDSCRFDRLDHRDVSRSGRDCAL